MGFGQRIGQLERELQRLIEGKRPPELKPSPLGMIMPAGASGPLCTDQRQTS